MPTIVDALAVALSLDTSVFEKGMKEASASFIKTKQEATQQAKEIEAAGKRASEFFSKLRNEALAFFAALVAAHGLKDFIAQVTASTAETGRLAKTLDMSAQSLGAWENAGKLVGGTAGSIAGSMQSLEQSLQRITLFGDSGVLEPLARVGISAFTSSGQLKTAAQIYSELADRVDKIDPARMTAIVTALGGSQDMVNLIERFGKGLRTVLALEAKFAPTDRDVKAAQNLQLAFFQTGIEITALGRSILTDLSPAIATLLGQFDNWIEKNREWLETNIEADLKTLVIDIKDFSLGVDDVVKGMGGWRDATELFFGLWLGTKFLKVLANIALLKIALFGTGGSAATTAGAAATGIGLGGVAAIVAGASAGSTPNPDPTPQQIDEAQRREAQAAGVDPAAWARMSWWEKAKRLWGAKPRSAGWWTPERQQHAIDALMKGAGLSAVGARALVERWATVESPNGPGSANNIGGGHFGIAQWDRKRGASIWGNADFDAQLALAVRELNSTESRAAGELRAAQTPWDAARGASAFERAEGWNAGISTDNFTAATAAAIVRSAKMASISNNNSRTAHVSSQTHIGSITVHTQAQDGAGIAKDLKQSIDQYSFVNLADYGAQ